MSTYIIYAFYDQNDNPYYVGLTRNPKARFRRHRANVKYGCKLPCYNKARKVIREGGTLDIRTVQECTAETVDKRERYWIRKFRSLGYKLYNLTEGGRAYPQDPTTREKLRKGRTGRVHSDETRRRIAEGNRGKKMSEASRRKMRRAWKLWRKKPDWLRQVPRKGIQNIKLFVAISPDGKEFVTTNGLSAFCEQHGLEVSNLHAVLRGKRKHHKGWTLREMDNDRIAS